jgi:hypothetical protein
METVQLIINFLMAHLPAIVGFALFILSDVLGGIPSVKANSVYQLVVNLLVKEKAREDAEKK